MDLIEDIKRRAGITEHGAGPSRIVQHMQAGRPFIVISAERDYNDERDNKIATHRLKEVLARYPVGYIKQSGEWDNVPETSFLIMPRNKLNDDQIERFKEFGKALMKEFDQMAIVFGDGKHIVMINHDGTMDDWGLDTVSFNHKKMKDAGGHSTIKGRDYVFSPSDDNDPSTLTKVA